MFELTVKGTSAADLVANVIALAALMGGTAAVAAPPSEQTPAKAAAKKTEPKAADPTPTAEPAPTPAAEPAALDFNKDVAPVVIATVERSGKPAVIEVLEQFGVGKASDVAPGQWGELIEALSGLADAA